MRALDSVDQVIEKLGGNAAVARLLGLGPPAVSNFVSRGKIPAHFYVELEKRLNRLGFRTTPALFGMYDRRIAADG